MRGGEGAALQACSVPARRRRSRGERMGKMGARRSSPENRHGLLTDSSPATSDKDLAINY